MKRELLERAVREAPAAEAFEAWLHGSQSAMAIALLEEWRLAHQMPEFAAWLERGAPSADTQ